MSRSSNAPAYPAATQGARVLAGINAIYQGGVGVLSILLPAVADQVYRLSTPVGESALALTRILGGMMVTNALGLAWFARDPIRNPVLAPLLLIGAVFGVISAAIPCAVGELLWSQMVGSLVFQTLLGGGLAAHLYIGRSQNQAGLRETGPG